MFGPNPNAVHPNENIPSVCYIKNTITRPNIIVGEYTYYDDPENSEDFERHVTHHYEFIGDKLINGIQKNFRSEAIKAFMRQLMTDLL